MASASSSPASLVRRSIAACESVSAHALAQPPLDELAVTVRRGDPARFSPCALASLDRGVASRGRRCRGSRSALEPSITTEHALLDIQAAVDESASSSVVTRLFSVEPSHSPSGIFTPSVVIPSATTLVWSFRPTPSIISTASRTSSRRRAISSISASLVRATNVLETADFDVDRADRLDLARRPAPAPAGIGASRRRRASAPAPPLSADLAQRSAHRSGPAPPRSPSFARIRGRSTATRRPPSVTSPVIACRGGTATRSGSCCPSGPQHPRPPPPSTPPARRARRRRSARAAPPSLPRRAAPSASCILGGSGSSDLPPRCPSTCAGDTVCMAVPPVFVPERQLRWT